MKLREWTEKYGIRQYVCNVQEEPTLAYCGKLAESLTVLAEATEDAGKSTTLKISSVFSQKILQLVM